MTKKAAQDFLKSQVVDHWFCEVSANLVFFKLISFMPKDLVKPLILLLLGGYSNTYSIKF